MSNAWSAILYEPSRLCMTALLYHPAANPGSRETTCSNDSSASLFRFILWRTTPRLYQAVARCGLLSIAASQAASSSSKRYMLQYVSAFAIQTGVKPASSAFA